MGKFADRYFCVEPWSIVEKGFDPAYGEVSESIFSLANEYMGHRGYFEEGYSGESLVGSYVNGIYETRAVPKSGYCGMLTSSDFMPNTVDWLYTRVKCNGKTLDLAYSRFEDFSRTLDMKSGVLRRSFIWQADKNTRLALSFERFVSMDQPHIGAQRMNIKVLKGKADLELVAGLDFSRPHMSAGKNLWEQNCSAAGEDYCRIKCVTAGTGQAVFAAARFMGLGDGKPVADKPEKTSALGWRLELSAGEERTLTRLAALVPGRNGPEAEGFSAACTKAKQGLYELDYESLQQANAQWWEKQWELSDIVIEGDDENQQGIRFCVFQMHQTLHMADHSAVIGAKGLTGEAYNGNAFWDTEVYCLPFYLFNNPIAAKNILQFRYDTLNEARDRAVALDNKGAFYPIATISGKECCDLWQHANLQLHPSTSVMYAIRLYTLLTGNKSFLYDCGVEMLAEICRMLVSRSDTDPRTGKFGFYGIMGPDEFHMMVNHNTYTNYMAVKTFEYTLAALRDMETEAPAEYKALADKLGLSKEETELWKTMSENMTLLYDEETAVYEQHEGYYGLPHVDVSKIPTEEFPMYSHWAYDRIYRNDIGKQPDVLMFMLLFNTEFSLRELEANFRFYEPRCIHESSLSPSVHSILAQQLGEDEQAFELFRFATRMDLDNYNRNTREGLHTASIAGAWMNIVYGFGGLRCDDGALRLAPAIPDKWKSYSFSVAYRGAVLRVETLGKTLRLTADKALELFVYGEAVGLEAGVTKQFKIS